MQWALEAQADKAAGIERAKRHRIVKEKEMSSLEVFNQVWEDNVILHCPRRLNPNAGRLKAGESLYIFAAPVKRTAAW